MARRKRWVPQRSEAERQELIAELRRWRMIVSEGPEPLPVWPLQGAQVEMRRLEEVLRLDWDHGWPPGESVAVDPRPVVDVP